MKIYAIVWKTAILAILVPFESGMDVKGPFEARIESINSSTEKSQTVRFAMSPDLMEDLRKQPRRCFP